MDRLPDSKVSVNREEELEFLYIGGKAMKYILIVLLMMNYVAPVSLAAESAAGTNFPISKAGLRITHTEGASCYDQDRIYKRCVDQNQLFEIAVAEAYFKRKDLLLIYGEDYCCWCNTIHNFMYFSDEAQKIQDAFVVRTIAKDEHNDTGEKLIDKLRSSLGESHFYILPYLIRIDGKTGKVKEFIHPSFLERGSKAKFWCGYDSKEIMAKLFPSE